MNRKMSKRQKDIKSKLMAAISMLLVSSIMMVSSTYAWFTLSTAPEVTGITTQVGANGNLEMALLPVDAEIVGVGKDYGISTGTGDSMAKQAANLANVTWGNLVDLSQYYGLEKIVLQPSALNGVEQDDKTVTYTHVLDNPLAFPKYGSDGRISELNKVTSTGVYTVKTEGETAQFWETTTATRDTITNDVLEPRGVRAVGTVSGMTPRESDRRKAMQDADAAASAAKTATADLLADKGNALAGVAVKYAIEKENAKFETSDVETLMEIVEGLDAALNKVEEAYKRYIYAYVVATNTEYSTMEDSILSSDFDTLEATYGSSPIANMFNFIHALEESQGKITTAYNGLNALLQDDDIRWNDIVTPMSYIANKDSMLINGNKISTDLDPFSLLGDEIVLTMDTGSGIFADIADHCGEYSKPVTVSVSYMGQNVDLDVTMKAQPATGTRYLQQSKNLANVAIAGDDATAEAMPISEYYGYIIDLAFRTNADTSYLMLQTEPEDRIYSGSTSGSTMGGGSTWTFTSQADDFTPVEMINLMKSLRVVFFNPDDDNAILGYGVMDVEPEATTTVVGKLKLATSPKVDTTTGKYDLIEDNKLIDLTKNTVHRVSVLVYLDGNTLTNADVAFGGDTSMLGSLNLQFASSAELNPMEYSDLQESSNSFKQISNFDFAADDTGYSAEVFHHNSGILGAEIGKGNITVTDKNVEKVTFTATVTEGEGEDVTTRNVTAEAEYTLFNNIYGWAAQGFGSDASKISNLVIDIEGFTGGTVTDDNEDNGEGGGSESGEPEDGPVETNKYNITYVDTAAQGATLSTTAEVEEGADYVFALNNTDTDNYTYTVTYSMEGSVTDQTLTADEDGNYTVFNVNGAITITVTAEAVSGGEG